MTNRLAARIIVLVALGCSDTLLSSDEVRELNRAEGRWKARGFADYTYEMQRLCFCPPEINRWTRVTVRAGVVVDATPVEPDPTYPITTLSYWQPIDSLFVQLRQAADDSYGSGAYSDVIVQYDAQLGYPTRIEWVEKPNVADAASTLNLRNVTPLQ